MGPVNGTARELCYTELQRQGIIVARMSLCQWKINVNNIFHVCISEWNQTTWVLREVSWLRNHLPHMPAPQLAAGAAKHHRLNAYLTAMIGHYIRNSLESWSWHTFETTHAGSLPYASATLRCMMWKGPGTQSEMLPCQLLRLMIIALK